MNGGCTETSTAATSSSLIRYDSFWTSVIASKWLWCIFQLPEMSGRRSGIGSRRSASRPGRSPCSISSSEAPPPVETWSIRSARPNSATAAAESPPPTTVKPRQSATASATCPGPGLEAGVLEGTHRPVPQHAAGLVDDVAEGGGRARARCRRPSNPGPGSTPAWTHLAAGTGVEQLAALAERGDVLGQDDAVAGPGQQLPARVDLVGLEQRVADVAALRAEEREAHGAADDQRVADLRGGR